MEASDLEDGQELCPICGATNFPGELEYCVHFVGAAWCGQMVWLEASWQGFWGALNEMVSLLEELELSAQDNDELLSQIEDNETANYASVALLGGEYSIYDVLNWPIFVPGRRVETKGMIGESGNTYYSREPANAFYGRETLYLEEVIRKLRSRISRITD